MFHILQSGKTSSRVLRLAVALLLSLCIAGVAVVDAYSAPFIAALSAPVFIAIAKALIAAGLTFLTVYSISQLVEEYWSTCGDDIRAWWNQVRAGVVVIITDVAWASIRAYVNSKVSDEGIQSISVPTAGSFNMVFHHVPYETPGGVTQQVITSLPAVTLLTTPLYCDHVVIGDSTGYGDITAYYLSSFASGYPSLDVTTGKVTVMANSSYGATIYNWNKYTQTWQLWGNFSGSQNRSVTFYTLRSRIFWFPLEGAVPDLIFSKWNSFVNRYADAIRLDNASVDVQAGSLAPEYDYVNTGAGTRAITVPQDVTDANVSVRAQELVDVTNTDLMTEPIAENPGTGNPDGSILDILAGILAAILGIPSLLQDICVGIRDTLAAKVQALVDAITGAISAALEGIRANTAEEELESSNVFSFFISLLLIMKHLALIVMKFNLFLIAIKDVPAQSNLFDPNTKAVIDYLHSQSLPIFNISFMQIINAFIGILIAVAIIGVINRNVRSNL